jgi:hypothetical protein
MLGLDAELTKAFNGQNWISKQGYSRQKGDISYKSVISLEKRDIRSLAVGQKKRRNEA